SFRVPGALPTWGLVRQAGRDWRRGQKDESWLCSHRAGWLHYRQAMRRKHSGACGQIRRAGSWRNVLVPRALATTDAALSKARINAFSTQALAYSPFCLAPCTGEFTMLYAIAALLFCQLAGEVLV